MSDRTILILVGVVALYFIMKRQPTAQVALPAPQNQNPTGGGTQNVAQDTFNQVMGLLNNVADIIGNAVNAQSSPSTT